MLAFGLAALVAVAHPTSVEGAGDASRAPRWHAVAAPPRPGLPAVSVDLGEPGGYISVASTPVSLKAVNGDRPFDGFIGVHFEVERKRTRNVPIVARARLAPRQSWSFETSLQLAEAAARYMRAELKERELVVEWRDSAMAVIAKKSVGLPPWSDVAALRVVPDNQPLTGAPCLGGNAYEVRAAELHADAQWYSGFNTIVMPTASWFAAPSAVRDAVFGSGVDVVFVGIPADVPNESPIDRAIVPVSFDRQPGAYEIAWPYTAAGQRVASPLSWRPKEFASPLTDGACPYVVRSGIAAFIADEQALSRPLPQLMIRPALNSAKYREVGVKPTLVEWFRQFKPLAATGVLLIIVTLLWVASRRTPRLVVLGVSVLLAAGVLAARASLRKPSGLRRVERDVRPLPDVVRRIAVFQPHGAAPLGEQPVDAVLARTAVFGRGQVVQEAELRSGSTPAGFGAMYVSDDYGTWDSTARWARRQEIDPMPQIREVSRNEREFVFETAVPARVAEAWWSVNGRSYSGQSRVRGARVVVRAGERLWYLAALPFSEWFDSAELPWTPAAASASIRLGAMNGEQWKVSSWYAPLSRETVIRGRWRVAATADKAEGNRITALAALPSPMPGRDVTVLVPRRIRATHVQLSGPGGSSVLKSTGKIDPMLREAFALAPGELARLGPRGGILMITVDVPEPVQDFDRHIAIEATEKRP